MTDPAPRRRGEGFPRGARLPKARDGSTALTVARRCAREAGVLARAGFKEPLLSAVKGRGNIVTETDFAVEARLQEIIAGAFPDHAVLSEETRADTKADGWVWVIDPIDGTKNFSMGIPLFCINIALCLDGEPQLGLTYEPVRREEFLAVRGRGLRVNGVPARASARETVFDSVLGMDAGFDDVRGGRMFESMTHIWPEVQAIRIIGSAALGIAYAACGRLDLFVHHSLYPWDIAAGLLLVAEAGGLITDRDGGSATLWSESVIAGGAGVHADFRRRTADLPWRE